MATLKLGNASLSGISFGGNTTIVTPKRFKTNLRTPKVTQLEALQLRGNNVVTPPSPSGWLLANGIWNDNGVWDDTQVWTENNTPQSNWLLASSYWDDNGVWDDTQNWND